MIHPLLKRAKAEGTPLIDGETVTFLWRGKSAPLLGGDFNDWGFERGRTNLQQITPTLWTHTETLPANAYLEYAFFKTNETEARLRDPFNTRRLSNGVAQYNHFFYMPEAEQTNLGRLDRGVPNQLLTSHIVEAGMLAATPQREVLLYQPPSPRPCPLLVVFDGPDYVRRGRLVNMVDNLIAQRRIRPVALALVANGKQARGLEYGCSDLTVRFIDYAVLPLAQLHLNLININEHPGAYGVMGASMGGVAALYTALRLPEIFGSVLSQSGAFSMLGHDFVVWDLLRASLNPALKIWMDVGRYDLRDLLVVNQSMHELLQAKNYDVTYREYPAGHNYTAWQNDVWRGLEWLYPVEE